jgi:hypothetical protein
MAAGRWRIGISHQKKINQIIRYTKIKMSKFSKKAASFGLVFVTVAFMLSMAPVQALTIAETQAQIDTLLAQIQTMQAQLGAQGAGTTSYTFTKNLTLGATDAEVKTLQQFLNANGYIVSTSGAGSVGSESTYFGTKTKAALIAFQTAKGLTAIGFFGPLTRATVASMSTTAPVTAFPAGCTSAVGFSTTTGLSCATAAPVTAFPAGCTSAVGLSSTTGLSCAGAVAAIGAPLTVALAVDNLASANVQRGSANNTVLKFTIAGGATATTVSGLTLRSYGTTEATGLADVSAVKLYDESGIQIGNNRTPAGNAVNFVIVPTLSIPANGSRTITVTANIGTAAQVMSIVRYGIESATGILGGATFAGTYPLIGNSFTIVPAGQLGGVSVSKFSTAPKTAVKVGEKDIVLERFNVSAGSNEDIAINQITLTNTGTISDSDVSNIRLRQVGLTTVLAGPASLSNKKVTFNLGTTINLVKGASINLEVVGDIADGGTATRTIILSVAAGGVVARGAVSGTNIVSTGSSTGNTITLGNETLSISMSAAHPQGAASLIIKTTNKKDLAKFDVRANGGSIIINAIAVNFVNATNPLTTVLPLTAVGLYDGDSLISDLLTVDDEADQAFALNYTIAANTTKTLTVKGITNSLTAAPDTVTVTWSGYTAYGLSSGEAVTSASIIGNVAATPITVYSAGSVTPTADTTKTPYSQTILAPSNGVTMAALKLYALREDMKLNNVTLHLDSTAAGGGAADYVNDDISSVTLYADDGVTALTNAVVSAADGGATKDKYAITATDILSDIVVAKGTYKTILVKANVGSGFTTVKGTTFTIDDTDLEFQFVGQDSGTTFDNQDAGAAVTFAITSPYVGGTFNGNAQTVTIAKAATSPSGSISRGSQTVTGIWNVVNNSSTNASINLDTIKFTSKTGLPSGLVDDTDDALFMLYDGDGTKISGAHATNDVVLVIASGTVQFKNTAGAGNPVMMTVAAGETKQLKLVMNTIDTSKFASSTQFQWSIEDVDDVTNATALNFVGYAAGVWSIPAVANVVTLP